MQISPVSSNFGHVAPGRASAGLPVDRLVSTGGAAAQGLVTLLDVRVPTTARVMDATRREEILAKVQPGDIILETNLSYPGWERLEYWTMHSHYTHAAIYEGDGKFLEATTPDGVQRTDLREYLEGPIKVALVRPVWKTPEEITAALDSCRSKLGTPYDSGFNMNDSQQVYCAELVFDALPEDMRKQVPLVTFAGRQAVSPDAFMKMPGAQIVHDDKSNYWKNKLHHWPVALATGATAALAASQWGVPGLVGGLVGGFVLSVCTGNYIQTGHFNMAGSGKGHPTG